MSALSAAASDEDGDIINGLKAANAYLLDCNRGWVELAIRLRARVNELEEMLAAVGAGGIGPLMQAQREQVMAWGCHAEARGEKQCTQWCQGSDCPVAPLTAPQPPVVEQPQGTRHETAIPDKLASQAIDALASYCNTGEIEGADDLLASLLYSIEHSQQPAMNHIAQRKLDFLLADGWAISGYSICKLSPSSEMRHGFVTAGGLVGWWQQPQVEQEPVAWQYRMRPDWGSKKDCWGPWQDCTKEQAAMYQRVPLLHDWAYESRQLYTHPQPKPLTDEEITEITFKLLNEGASMHDFARAIEAAHGIRGEA